MRGRRLRACEGTVPLNAGSVRRHENGCNSGYCFELHRGIDCGASRDGPWRWKIRMELVLPVGYRSVYRSSRCLLSSVGSNESADTCWLCGCGDGALMHLLVLHWRNVVLARVYLGTDFHIRTAKSFSRRPYRVGCWMVLVRPDVQIKMTPNCVFERGRAINRRAAQRER
jgi:hypothetical protein